MRAVAWFLTSIRYINHFGKKWKQWFTKIWTLFFSIWKYQFQFYWVISILYCDYVGIAHKRTIMYWKWGALIFVVRNHIWQRLLTQQRYRVITAFRNPCLPFNWTSHVVFWIMDITLSSAIKRNGHWLGLRFAYSCCFFPLHNKWVLLKTS